MEGASQNGDGGGGGLRWMKSPTVSILCVSPPANQRHLQTGSQVVSAPEVEKVDLLRICLTSPTSQMAEEETRGPAGRHAVWPLDGAECNTMVFYLFNHPEQSFLLRLLFCNHLTSFLFLICLRSFAS